LAQFKEFLTLA